MAQTKACIICLRIRTCMMYVSFSFLFRSHLGFFLLAFFFCTSWICFPRLIMFVVYTNQLQMARAKTYDRYRLPVCLRKPQNTIEETLNELLFHVLVILSRISNLPYFIGRSNTRCRRRFVLIRIFLCPLFGYELRKLALRHWFRFLISRCSTQRTDTRWISFSILLVFYMLILKHRKINGWWNGLDQWQVKHLMEWKWSRIYEQKLWFGPFVCAK